MRTWPPVFIHHEGWEHHHGGKEYYPGGKEYFPVEKIRASIDLLQFPEQIIALHPRDLLPDGI